MDAGGNWCGPAVSGHFSRELNETVFALSFLETGGVARAQSCEKR